MPSLIDDDIVEAVYEQLMTHGKHAVTRVVATDAVDAVLQLMLKHRSQAKNIVKMVSGVINARLVRRLCDRCKQPYQPNRSSCRSLVFPGSNPKAVEPDHPTSPGATC